MGKGLLYFYNNKVKKEWKISWISAFIIGLIIHLFKFSNTILHHDSVYNYYSNQDMTSSGRWFLSIACSLSSYFDLPWVIGIFSLSILGVVCVIMVEMFEVKNPVVIVLISGLITAFPGVSETFIFSYTADGYFIAMLLSSLAVYVSRIDKCKFVRCIISLILICFSCAIYQAYVSFGMLLAIFHFIDNILKKRVSDKQCIKYIGMQTIVYIGGIASYYIVWRIILAVTGTTVGSYLGISSTINPIENGFTVSTIAKGFENGIRAVSLFFCNGYVFVNGVTPYYILNAIIVILGIIGFVSAAKKADLFKRKKQCILTVLAILLILPCSFIWSFVSLSVFYEPRMFLSLCICYIYCAILFDRFLGAIESNIVGIMLGLIVVNNAIMANILYFALDRNNTETLAVATEMIIRIHEIEDETPFDKIAIVNDEQKLNYNDAKLSDITKDYYLLLRAVDKNLLLDQKHISLYLSHTFNFDIPFVSNDEHDIIEQNPEIDEMAAWPSKDSMRVIDDVLVIKLYS